jgi:hypothetical protein
MSRTVKPITTPHGLVVESRRLIVGADSNRLTLTTKVPGKWFGDDAMSGALHNGYTPRTPARPWSKIEQFDPPRHVCRARRWGGPVTKPATARLGSCSRLGFQTMQEASCCDRSTVPKWTLPPPKCESLRALSGDSGSDCALTATASLLQPKPNTSHKSSTYWHPRERCPHESRRVNALLLRLVDMVRCRFQVR